MSPLHLNCPVSHLIFFLSLTTEHANGTYRHYAEPRHATEAITIAAQTAMIEHVRSNALEKEARKEARRVAAEKHLEEARRLSVENQGLDAEGIKMPSDDTLPPSHTLSVSGHVEDDNDADKPLFLYVAYTAAHSPLQPMPGEAKW